jgi:hypothetical protein
MPTTTKQQRIAPADLAGIAYDPDRSTRWTQLYNARSDTTPGREYEVRHDVEAGTWDCNCPATVTCKHIRRVALYARVRWWERTLERYSPSMLREVRATRQYTIDMGDDGIEDRAAVIACARLLGEGA